MDLGAFISNTDDKGLAAFGAVWLKSFQLAGGSIPKRNEIKLSDLRSLANNITTLELKAPRQFYVRMSSTVIDTQFDRNMTGVSIRDHTSEQAYKGFCHFHNTLLKHPCGGFAHDFISDKNGKRWNCKYLILPLQNREGEITLCMSYCSLSPSGFNIVETGDTTRITYDEFQEAYFLNLGFGTPPVNPFMTV